MCLSSYSAQGSTAGDPHMYIAAIARVQYELVDTILANHGLSRLRYQVNLPTAHPPTQF